MFVKEENTFNALVFDLDEVGVVFLPPASVFVHLTPSENVNENVRSEVAAALSVAVGDLCVPPN